MPDLNTVPASPHILARRASSQQMPPPPVPSSPSLNILPSNQSIVNQAGLSSSLPSPQFHPSGNMAGISSSEASGVTSGPGPMRHPRPMTAADLHLELEKEQEAVVNRLSRELTLLRAAHNASVVSNTSSTSASGTESAHLADPHHASFSHPRNGRHHRTSSNTSSRSFTANAGSVSATSLVGISSPAPVRPGNPAGGISLSRQNSASRRSRTESPSPYSQGHTPSHSFTQSSMADLAANGYFSLRGQPPPPASQGSTPIPIATPGSASEFSPGLLPATSRYEETAFYRAELDAVKRENEALKRQVRDLERMVRERRTSDASRASQPPASQPPANQPSASQPPAIQPTTRPRSESVSTTASVSVAASATGAGGASIVGQREGRDRTRVVSMLSTTGSVAVGVPEDEVRVGESAASAGLRG